MVGFNVDCVWREGRRGRRMILGRIRCWGSLCRGFLRVRLVRRSVILLVGRRNPQLLLGGSRYRILEVLRSPLLLWGRIRLCHL